MSQPPKVEIIYEDHGFRYTILWVSRHRPLPAQITELKRKLGSIKVVMLSGVVPNAEYVVEVARKYNADIIVPVLPLSFIARLAELSRKQGFTVLFVRMDAIAQTTPEKATKLIAEAPEKRTMTTYADGSVKVHEFKGFEKVVKVEVVTEPW